MKTIKPRPSGAVHDPHENGATVDFPWCAVVVGKPEISLLEPAQHWVCQQHLPGSKFVTVPITITNHLDSTFKPSTLVPWSLIEVDLTTPDGMFVAPKVWIPVKYRDRPYYGHMQVELGQTDTAYAFFSLNERMMQPEHMRIRLRERGRIDYEYVLADWTDPIKPVTKSGGLSAALALIKVSGNGYEWECPDPTCRWYTWDAGREDIEHSIGMHMVGHEEQ